MQFHLNYKPAISSQKLTHQDKLLLIGSCFSEHIGKRLSDLKFNVNSNPFGIIFNPWSIANSLNRIIYKTYFTEKDVFEHEGRWICLDSHSSLSAASQAELLDNLNTLIDIWHQELKTSTYLMLTFGSAYAYKYKSQNNIVANCHKLPQAHFDKVLLDTNVIVSDYVLLLKTLKQFNPQLKIIFTVSPVKHLRDGLIENSLSKSILIQSVHQLIHQFDNCLYFPAYELVNDDLRDYRFYEADMAHPNKQAIEYVWQKFSDTYFSEDTKSLNEKLKDIHLAMNHKPLNKEGDSFISFKKNYYIKCCEMIKQQPSLDLKSELQYFSI